MFLVDTNVFSELAKPQPAPEVVAWLGEHPVNPFLSVFTIAELQSRISQLAGARRNSFLQQWLADFRSAYRNAIIGFEEPEAIAWRNPDAYRKRRGRKSPLQDNCLAATACNTI